MKEVKSHTPLSQHGCFAVWLQTMLRVCLSEETMESMLAQIVADKAEWPSLRISG